MALTKIDDRGLKTPIDLLDNEKIRFGTGNDLQIYHDGTSAYIKSEISGHFNIDVQYDLYIRKQDGTEPRAKFHNDGSVELYYDGSKKFETNSTGAKYTGVISSANGWSDDTTQAVQINEYGQLLTKANTGTDAAIVVHQGGNQTDNRRFKVTVDGSTYLSSDSAKLNLGASNDLQIYHNGSNSYLENSTGNLIIDNGSGVDMYINSGNDIYIRPQGSENGIKVIGDGAVELYYDNAKMFYTHTAGAIIKRPSGGDTELSIYGSEGNNAALKLASDDGDDNDDYYRLVAKTNHDFALENYRSGGWETNLTCTGNGAVDLYYDNSKKLATTTYGVKFDGTSGAYLQIGTNSTATKNWHIGAENSDGSFRFYNNNYGAGAQRLLIKSDGTIDLNASPAKIGNSRGSGATTYLYADDLRITDAGITSTYAIIDSGGIKFNGDTAGANGLDDYEEGAFTPVLGDGGPTFSSNNNKGYYIKVGKMVHISIQIDCSISGAGGGNFTITGLPFASSNNMGGHGQALSIGPMYAWDYPANIVQLGPRVDDNSTRIKIWVNYDNAADSVLQWPFGSSGHKYGSIAGTYVAA